MCDYAYHAEAQRRARVLQRMCEAERNNQSKTCVPGQDSSYGVNPISDSTCHYYRPPNYKSYNSQAPLGYIPQHPVTDLLPSVQFACTLKDDQGRKMNQNLTCNNKSGLQDYYDDENQPRCGKLCQAEKLGKTYFSQPPLGRTMHHDWVKPDPPLLRAKPKEPKVKPACGFPIDEFKAYPSQPPLGRTKNYMFQPPGPIVYDPNERGYPPISCRDRNAGLEIGPTFNYDIYRDLKWQQKWIHTDHISSFKEALHSRKPDVPEDLTKAKPKIVNQPDARDVFGGC